MYDLCINTEFGQRNPSSNPWTTLTFFIDFIFSQLNIGTLDRTPTSTFPLYFFSLKSPLTWQRGCGIEPPQPLLIFHQILLVQFA